jgi:hypothetical protein
MLETLGISIDPSSFADEWAARAHDSRERCSTPLLSIEIDLLRIELNHRSRVRSKSIRRRWHHRLCGRLLKRGSWRSVGRSSARERVAGYPGVPAGTAANVAKEAQVVSDFVLYDSLLQNEFAPYVADNAYASLPFFSGMVKYDAALSTFLTDSFTDSQNLPALPKIDDASRIEIFATTSHTVDSNPHFVVNTIGNGVVPKRISDYEIPLHYAHNNQLNGVKFSAVASVSPSVDVTQKNPLVYPLYLVDKTVASNAQRRVLSYKWDVGTYFLDNATASGLPDDVKIAQQLQALQINDYAGTASSSFSTFLMVNKASGEVLTNTGAQGGHLFLSHFALDNKAQEWEFRLQGCSGGTTYTPRRRHLRQSVVGYQ